jgi:ADP-ribose pyrophosphatase YjhB (NUDIX family)
MNETSLKAQLAVLKAKALMIKVASRWPSGSPQSKGGQFAPKTVAGGSGSKSPAKMFYTPPPANTFEPKGWDGSGMWGKPSAPPAGAKPHPQINDHGKPVSINYPSKPSHASTWTDPAKTASFVPGGDTPDALNGVPMKAWNPSKDGWGKVAGTDESLEADFPFEPHRTKSTGAGVLIVEDDGRVWLTAPTNAFGGYKNTYPKGTAESGLTLQQNAIKEAYEETGLKVKIVGVLGDYERDTSKARMYIAQRVGGTPKNMGWESQAIRLAPLKDANVLLNKPHDKAILDDLSNIMGIAKAAAAPTGSAKGGKGGAWETQPRWPSGTALGGQWKTMGADGITQAPVIAGGLEGKNSIYQKAANAAYAAAQAGDLTGVQAAIDKYEGHAGKFAAGVKSSSHMKWGAQVHQFATQAAVDVKAKTKATASADAINGPIKLSEFKQVGAKPGGSNPGALYKHPDEPNSIYLVKGNKQLQTGSVTLAVSDDRAKNEVLSSHLLLAAGVGAPIMGLVDLGKEHGGGLGVASLMVDGAAAFNPNNATHVAAAQADFAVNAWLANYDVLGMGFDNTVIKDGKAINIDPGGALLFRAQGQPKGLMHGVVNGVLDATAPEFESMRVTTSEQIKVFGSMSKEQLTASAQKLAQIDNATISKLVNTYGPGDAKAKAALIVNLIQRRDVILAKTGLNVPAAVSAPAAQAAPAAPKAPKADPAAQAKIKDAVDALSEAGKKIVGNIKADTYNILPPKLSNDAAEHHKTLATAVKLAAAKGDLDGLGLAAATAKMNMNLAKNEADLDNASEVWANATDHIANVKGKIAADAKKIAESAPDYMSVLFSGGVSKPEFKASSTTVIKFYGDLADKAGELHAKGDLAGLKAMASDPKNGKYVTSHASPNSKLLQTYYSGLVTALEGSQAATVVATAQAAQKAISEPVANPPKPKEAKAPNPAMPNFDAYKLPSSNSNATSHNTKVDLIASLAAKGDAAGIAALAYGTNTYAKKQVGLANSALKALGSSAVVATGQTKNSNSALTGGATVQQVRQATVKVKQPQPQPHPATVGGKPDMTKLDMSKAVSPPKPVFDKSSKAYVNEQNNALANQVKAKFLAGNYHDLASMTFDVLDKESGKVVGQKHISDHPAKDLKAYFDASLAVMREVAYPPQPLKQFDATTAKSLADISAAMPGKKFGTTVNKVKANEKLGFWVALGKVSEPERFMPKKTMAVSEAAVQQAYKDYTEKTKTNKLAKAFINGIQASGSYNDLFRDGKEKDSNGNKLSDVAKAALDYAQEKPEGTTVHRWQHMSADMINKIKQAGPGTVFQATGSMCTSMSPTATSHFGPHRINIVYAKGAKAVDSFGSGGFASEKEITTLPNSRFLIQKVEEVTGKSGGGTRMEITVLMLPPDDLGIKP